MKIKGLIIEELPGRSGESANGPWKCATYVIQTLEAYPKHMVFDVWDGREGRIARLNIQAGKRYEIEFDIDAKESKGRWFNSISVFSAEQLDQSHTEQVDASDMI